MLYSIVRLYGDHSDHDDKLIESLAYSNGVSKRRMAAAYWQLRNVLCRKTQEPRQK